MSHLVYLAILAACVLGTLPLDLLLGLGVYAQWRRLAATGRISCSLIANQHVWFLADALAESYRGFRFQLAIVRSARQSRRLSDHSTRLSERLPPELFGAYFLLLPASNASVF